MYVTDTMPRSVTCMSIPARELFPNTMRMSDPGFAMLIRMDNEAVFRVFGLVLPGHSNWYRFHGLDGGMEMTRGPGYFGPEQVRVWHEEYALKEGQVTERVYSPEWPEHKEEASKAGHGGGDFFVNYHFAEAIRTGKQPFLDVYRGVAMTSVGILGWKSALEGGRPFDVPDFRDEAARKPYESDAFSPFPDQEHGKAESQPPSSIHGDIRRSPEAEKVAMDVWKEIGYE